MAPIKQRFPRHLHLHSWHASTYNNQPTIMTIIQQIQPRLLQCHCSPWLYLLQQIQPWPIRSIVRRGFNTTNIAAAATLDPSPRLLQHNTYICGSYTYAPSITAISIHTTNILSHGSYSPSSETPPTEWKEL